MGNFTNSNLKQSHQNKAYRNVITDCQEVYCNEVEIWYGYSNKFVIIWG